MKTRLPYHSFFALCFFVLITLEVTAHILQVKGPSRKIAQFVERPVRKETPQRAGIGNENKAGSTRSLGNGQNKHFKTAQTIMETKMNRLTRLLLQFGILKNNAFFMTPGYFMALENLLKLTDKNSDSESALQVLLGTKHLPGDVLAKIRGYFRSLGVTSKTILYKKDGLNDTSDISLESDVNVLKGRPENYTLRGMKIDFHANTHDYFILNLMSFHYKWLPQMNRNHLRSVFHAGEKEYQTHFVKTTGLFEVVQEAHFMAVKLPLAGKKLTNEMKKKIETRIVDNNFLSTSSSSDPRTLDWDKYRDYYYEEVKSYKQNELEVYLVQSLPSTPSVPPMDAELFDKIMQGFKKAQRKRMTVKFPAFRIIGESMLPEHTVLKQGFLRDENSDFSVLGEHTKGTVKQLTTFCVDENGIDEWDNTTYLKYFEQEHEPYTFDSPFYFMIVHKMLQGKKL